MEHIQSKKVNLKPIGAGLVIIFLITATLFLKNPARDYLFPHAASLQLGIYLFCFILFMPLVRIKLYGCSLILLIGFLFFFFIALFSSLWSICPDLVLQRTFLVFFPVVFIVLLALSDTKPIDTFNTVSKSLAFFGSIVSLIGILLYFFGQIRATQFGTIQYLFSFGPIEIAQRVYGNKPLRISSLFGNPNTFASFLMISIMMTYYLFLKSFSRAKWGLLLLIQIGSMVLTFSRTGIGAIILGLFSLWLFHFSNFKIKITRFSIILLSLFFFIICFYGFYPSMLNTLKEFRGGLDLNERGMAWTTLGKNILDHPASGVGFGVSNEVILFPKGIDIGSHNIFIAIISEVGILGLLIFLLLWILPIWHGLWNLNRLASDLRVIISTCITILFMILFHQIFETSVMRYSFLNFIWAYVLALTVHPALKRSKFLRFPCANLDMKWTV